MKIVSYPQYDCSEDEREDVSPKEAVAYEEQILVAIAKENRHFEIDNYRYFLFGASCADQGLILSETFQQMEKIPTV